MDGLSGPGFGGDGGTGPRIGIAAAVLVAALALVACSPAWNWREVPVAGTDLVARMPCHPSRVVRSIEFAGNRGEWGLTSCETGGILFGVLSRDLVDAAQIEPVLSRLAEASRHSLGEGGRSAASEPIAVPGGTPFPGSVHLQLAGKRPDGGPIQQDVALFVHGTTIFQATVVGSEVPPDVAATFREGLHFVVAR